MFKKIIRLFIIQILKIIGNISVSVYKFFFYKNGIRYTTPSVQTYGDALKHYQYVILLSKYYKTDYHVKVFNRWGNVVFETQNYQEGWTGENAQDMVYTYLIEFKNSRGEFVQKKGYLTLVK